VGERRITLVTTAQEAFARQTDLPAEIAGPLRDAQEEWERRVSEFEIKISEWKELDPHVKAKVPRPQEPERKLRFLTGYNVTSLDRLIDRPGVFVTLERPQFRAEESLLTLGCDAVVVATGHRDREEFAKGMLENE